MSELLKATNLTKTYGKTIALDSISLTVESGKIIGLLGPNGSGKTTLIKLINGLLTPTEGKLTIDGQKPGIYTKGIVSYLPDNTFLDEKMNVTQAITYFADFFPDFRSELAFELVEHLGVDKNARLKSLSKGNREKVTLIMAMSRNAKLYVLDEPIAGVDPATRDYIISTILNNYNPEASVIISTHLISDIESILDDVIFINNGRIVLHKYADEIRSEYGKSVDEVFREVFRW